MIGTLERWLVPLNREGMMKEVLILGGGQKHGAGKAKDCLEVKVRWWWAVEGHTH